MTARRPLPRPITLLAAVLLSVLALFGASAPAAAHDELVATDPPADATLDALPPQLALTFSAELLGEAGANEVQVTDAAGTVLNDGPAVVTGTTVTQTLAGDARGPIRVLWRVVSSDGHPISGEFAFTVSAPAPVTTPAPDEASPPAPSATAEPSTTPEATATAPAETSGDGGAAVWIWVLVGVVAAALIGAVVFVLTARARRTRRGPDTTSER